MTLKLENAHAGLTVKNRDKGYYRYLKKGVDSTSPIGIRYSKLVKIYESDNFRKFEKSNKGRRGKMFLNGNVEHDAVYALRYARVLLGRNDCSVMEIKPEYLKNKPLNPLLKWRGGKTSDLKHLKSNFAEVFPKTIDRYFEPFLGGGAVWLAINSGSKMFVNDICQDLINFYHFIKSQDEKFLDFIIKMGKAWTFLANIASEDHKVLYGGDVSVLEKHRNDFNSISLQETCYPTMVKILKSKTARINKLDEKNKCTATEGSSRDNVEGALKAGYYTYVRNVFNSYITSNEFDSPLRSACFYFLRDYSFSAMFRYNSNGHFNVPYGGMCYNGRSPAARIDYWRSEDLAKHLNNTTFDNVDFEEFLNKHKPTAKDFMFIDPPYDSDFSTYDKKEFGQKEQERLADYLINKTQSQFIAVMKNTDFIYNLYKGHEKNGIRYATFEKDYQVSIRNRNDRNVEHLVVYRIGDNNEK
jgi:DNA adenine methylase